MTNVLILDTATNAVAVAVGTSNTDASELLASERAFHSENILTTIDAVLKTRKLSMSDIDLIGVGVGPGLFTGLRVGISTAHAFAQAQSIDLVYFSSLELTARSSFQGQTLESICVARDARRHELYSATYGEVLHEVQSCTVDSISFATQFSRIDEEQLISPAGFVVRANAHKTVVLDDIDQYEELTALTREPLPALVKPSCMIDLVLAAQQSGITVDALTPSVLYIRKSDAEMSWGVPS